MFESKSMLEIRLANGEQFFAADDDTKDTFISWVENVVERNSLGPLELTEVNLAAMRKKSTKQLQKARETAKDVELRMINEILVDRGALETPASENSVTVNLTLTDDDIPDDNIPEEDFIAPQQKTKNKKASKKEKTSKSKDKVKEVAPKKNETASLKKQLTNEEAISKLKEAEKNKGREVVFFCTKTKEDANGVIKGVRLDKRNNFIQYRILAEDGNMYGKGIDSTDLLMVNDPSDENNLA